MSDRKYENSRPRIPADIERSVKVESGHECAIKNCAEHTYLEIHHINGNREDNRIENLILLCDKHHKMSHADVIDRKSLREYKRLLNSPGVSSLMERFEKLEALVLASEESYFPETISSKSINIILEEGVLLGNSLRGTQRGNEVSQQIFSLVRKYGNHMGLESVDLMVRRDESYSRTGLSGLGILYDEFSKHAKSLGLVRYFESKELLGVAFYCALREKFPELGDMSACMKSLEFRYGGFKVDCEEVDLLCKYPNRGPSIVLDYLVYEGGESTPNNGN